MPSPEGPYTHTTYWRHSMCCVAFRWMGRCFLHHGSQAHLPVRNLTRLLFLPPIPCMFLIVDFVGIL
jgi:hypothetical protein